MAVHKLSILVEAIGAAKAAKGLKGLDATISRIGARGGQGLRTTADNLQRIGLIGAGVAAAGLVASVKAAADFESQLNTINTVADVTSSELAGIGKQIRDIAKSTGTPLEELTQGYYDLVSAGIAAGQANKVLAASNTLAIGGLSTAAEGVDLITTALNSYGVAAKDQGSEAVRFADIFAKSIESGKVTAAELAATFAGVGPIAATMGIEIEELAAGYAQLTAKGVPAAEAATQMEAAMVALMRKTGPLKKLEKQTGRNYQAIAGSKGLAYAFEVLRKDAEKAGVPLIELTGRKEALAYALNTTGAASASYNANLKDMQNAEGTAARQMASRQKGLNFQIARLKSLAIDAGITIGSKLLPKITPLAERAVAFLATHEADIERFGDNIAKGFDKALAFAEKIPWATIGAGLQTAADWAGKLMGAFMSMPPEVQSTIIALAGLNKLSGGAIGGITAELGKGLIKGVLGMNAGVVNIKAGVVNGGGGKGGVPGVPGAAVAAGGILGPGLGMAVAAAAAPIIAFQLVPRLYNALTGANGVGNHEQDAIPGTTGKGGVAAGPNAGIVRMFTPALGKLEAQLRDSSAEQRLELGLIANAARGTTHATMLTYQAFKQKEWKVEVSAETHRMLNGLIGKQGGKFLRTGVTKGTADENAGKLVELFSTSTNPSLVSMNANLAVLQGIAAKGDPKTRSALSGDIQALKGLIAAKNWSPTVNVSPTPVTVKVGFTIRELQAGIKVSKSYAGGYGSR